MGLFSNFQNNSAAIHQAGTLAEYVVPSLQEATSRGLRESVSQSICNALSSARLELARASSKGPLSMAETMLGKMLLLRKKDMVTAATHSLVAIYIASAKRSALYPEFVAEFESVHDRAGQLVSMYGGGLAVTAMWELNRVIGR